MTTVKKLIELGFPINAGCGSSSCTTRQTQVLLLASLGGQDILKLPSSTALFP